MGKDTEHMILLFYPSPVYILSRMKSVIKHNVWNKEEHRNALAAENK